MNTAGTYGTDGTYVNTLMMFSWTYNAACRSSQSLTNFLEFLRITKNSKEFQGNNFPKNSEEFQRIPKKSGGIPENSEEFRRKIIPKNSVDFYRIPKNSEEFSSATSASRHRRYANLRKLTEKSTKSRQKVDTWKVLWKVPAICVLKPNYEIQLCDFKLHKKF